MSLLENIKLNSLTLVLIRVSHALTICSSYIFVGHLTVYAGPQTGPGGAARTYQHGRYGLATVAAVLVDLLAARTRAVEVVVTTVLFSLVAASLYGGEQINE